MRYTKWIPVLILALLVVEYFSYGGAWITVVSLALFALWSAFAPDKGLIGPVRLPDDDGFLRNQNVQWWYWTGHLESEDGRRYGFEVVFFAFRNYGLFWDQLAQAAITDVNGNKFHFCEQVKWSKPKSLPGAFDLRACAGDSLRAVGGGGKDHLHSEIDGLVLDLDLVETKAPVRHYGGGPHPYYFGGYTYYYSRVSMATSGTLSIGGETVRVSGTSWFDRQYGDLMQAIFQGWQWFAIELDDDRQIMVYDLLGSASGVRAERAASITDALGVTRDLASEDFKIESLGKWKSPNTGITYPMGWRITLPRMVLTVTPVVRDQELCAKHDLWVGPEYWEGACAVSGDATGKAYVELNGFGRNPVISVDA
jgi:predicted secreted hydrolase